MRVCVTGLWHLGTVTATCLAAAGHEVVGHDPDPERVEALGLGSPPLQEPGLTDLLREGLAGGRLHFTNDEAEAVRGADVLWVAYDTPVDDSDRADPTAVTGAITPFFPHLKEGSCVLISSQLPVGATKQVERSFRIACPDRAVRFGYSPENLRLGTALESFLRPDRIVVGMQEADGRAMVSSLLEPLDRPIEWMSVESAEVTKHALNSFLATAIVFTNEIAALCEAVGADVQDVARALRGDRRIGSHAYLSAGTGYAGGTLGRDVTYLTDLAGTRRINIPLIASIAPSNRHQQAWVRRTLGAVVGDLRGKRIGIWGLTYKPGTDTLRRSAAIELCEWLVAQGAEPRAHDPAVRGLPSTLASLVTLAPDPLSAIRDADALVVMTGWPEYRPITADAVVAEMRAAVVVDPGRFLEDQLAIAPQIRYAAVGRLSG